MDLLHPPPKDDPDPRAMERYADAALDADHAARLALRAILKGGAPDLDALEKGAQVLEVIRGGRLSDGRVKLTEGDVAAARHLVHLTRAGAPREEIVAAAQRVHEIMNRPRNPALVRPREEYERDILDMMRARGIEPTEDNMHDVRRLAALRVEDAEDAEEVRLESDEICRRLFRLGRPEDSG